MTVTPPAGIGTCDRCLWFVPGLPHAGGVLGECRRLPPAPYYDPRNGHVQSDFPPVHSTGWCGTFRDGTPAGRAA